MQNDNAVTATAGYNYQSGCWTCCTSGIWEKYLRSELNKSGLAKSQLTILSLWVLVASISDEDTTKSYQNNSVPILQLDLPLGLIQILPEKSRIR